MSVTLRRRIHPWRWLAACCATLAAACAPGDPAGSPDDEAAIRHLTMELPDAVVESGAAPAAASRSQRWEFPAALADWRPLSAAIEPWLAEIDIETVDGGVRLALEQPPQRRTMLFIGGLAKQLDGLRLGDWETVLVRARTRDRLAGITVAYNIENTRAVPRDMFFFVSTDQAPPVFSDGSIQTYAIPLRARDGDGFDTPLDSLAVVFAGPAAATVDVLSIELVPRGAAFLDDYGVLPLVREGSTRETLFAHTPAELTFRLVPGDGTRLDLALASDAAAPVTYRFGAGRPGESPRPLLEITVEDGTTWEPVSVDLSRLAGSEVELVLAASSDRPGAVALWGSPILSRRTPTDLPNVVFYVIDGGGADLMSTYGYNRRTTPYLERLAAEGAIFDRAYSNSTWTQPSTASFLTSLQHSVLGGLRRGVHSTPIPDDAVTMAEHMRQGGYQTFALTSNPNAGRIIGAQQGVDVLWDQGTEHHSTSSVDLHELFWQLRREYPGAPYWVHFQTTDVHEPNEPQPPFAGLFVAPERREQLAEWDQRIFRAAGELFGTTSVSGFYDLALERADIDRQAYFALRRDLYDETMTHQDYQISRLVARLKAEGEWENTLFIVASDHGHPAGTFARFGRGMLEPQPEPWQGALFDAYAARVPLIFIWPDRIPAGIRVEAPVSMIDVLPTLLDLVGLPAPEVVQGQSLAPLLDGDSIEVRPVVLDEFRVHEETGEMIGNLEIVDGRWGASLEIGPHPGAERDGRGRHAVPAGGRWGAVHPYFPDVPRLLLYDLWNDPFARRAVNDEHPELVERYRRLLLEQWKAHRALAQRFEAGEEVALTPEQLRQLQALGYIQ